MFNLMSGMLGDLYTVIRTVGISVAAIAVVLCAFLVFIGGDDGMERARKIILFVIIGTAIIIIAPAVMVWIGDIMPDNTNIF